MEVHQLRYFLAVAETRNFSRAAERCHVAQPSLSQQIMKLEDELGERLFERTKRDVTLTPAGELFRGHAARVFEELETARVKIRDVRGLLRGRIELGALPTVAPYLLPAALRAFSERHPGIEIVVHEDTTANLMAGVLGKELDLAVVSAPIPERGLELTELFSEELWLGVARSHPLARKRAVTVEDLANLPFILMKEGHCLSGQTEHFCQARGLVPQTSFRSAQVETIQAFIAEGLGVSLIPDMARKSRKDARIVYRSLSPKAPRRTIVAIRHAQRVQSRAVTAFREFLETRAAPSSA